MGAINTFFIGCTIFLATIDSPALSQAINYWDNLNINRSAAHWAGAYPVTVSLTNGNVVFCWIAESDQIFGKIYDSQLKPVSDELRLYRADGHGMNIKRRDPFISKETSGVNDHEFAIAGLQDGGFVLVCCYDDNKLHMKIFAANGKSYNKVVKISPPQDFEAHHPSLSILQNGNIVVC